MTELSHVTQSWWRGGKATATKSPTAEQKYGDSVIQINVRTICNGDGTAMAISHVGPLVSQHARYCVVTTCSDAVAGIVFP